jgi:hypothetical protein
LAVSRQAISHALVRIFVAAAGPFFRCGPIGSARRLQVGEEETSAMARIEQVESFDGGLSELGVRHAAIEVEVCRRDRLRNVEQRISGTALKVAAHPQLRRFIGAASLAPLVGHRLAIQAYRAGCFRWLARSAF